MTAATFRSADGVVRAIPQPGEFGIDALWRPFPAFVGPVEPPMAAWLRMGSPASPWEVAALAMHAGPLGEQFGFDFGRAG